ncbi:Holliday junction branch migration DNA helicase RuvB [Patescibacteria group bacterium]|nr:Holliday junction branch migration DNA helicase RuvB [Patescibacteria group bacterium]MBU1885156.1 Holliday junction branch migration DNA helicase RuvB [Patescibacteria group bacterium]
MNQEPPTNQTPEDEILLQTLRAQSWDEFVGQDTIKKSLRLGIKAALQRKESLDHTLLFGPAGLGKTTLSYLIAREMNVDIRITSGTALNKAGDLAAILTNLKDGDVLFIDEIHRLPKIVEETLYPAMEDFVLDIVIGKGPSARTVRLELPQFTIVGATTRFGLLSGPFRDRFGLIHRLSYYKPQALADIIIKGAKKLNVKIDQKSALEIGRRSRGTPRIALKLLKRVRDYVQVNKSGQISPTEVHNALKMLAIDTKGLDETDRRLLKKIIVLHKGGPVGLSTMAATLLEDPGTIEEVIEPYLLQIGFLKRTPQGRVVTEAAYQYLGRKYP